MFYVHFHLHHTRDGHNNCPRCVLWQQISKYSSIEHDADRGIPLNAGLLKHRVEPGANYRIQKDRNSTAQPLS